MRRRYRRWRNDSGQALVEFAIVSPLIVLVILFAVWFYELVHIKLKVQEAGRYAAWEATGYRLHNYEEGPGATGQLSTEALQQIRTDTVQRYADLDSATQNSAMVTRLFAAQFTQPLVIMADRQEQQVPGGTIVNFVFSIAATVVDLVSALNYSSPNPVALDMIGSHLTQMGGAREDRLFGSPEWGFNREGYVCSSVTTFVQNTWFSRGVGRFIMPNWGVMITGQPQKTSLDQIWDQCVLADSWRLHDGQDIEGSDRIGVSSGTGYWEQVNRMYLVNDSARGAAERWVEMFRFMMDMALGLSVTEDTPPNLGDQDWVRATVVSKAYSGQNAEQRGKVRHRQDRGSTRTYDSSPVGLTGQGTKALGEYGKTLQDRGEHFMGCPTTMQLGCPSSTLQQDNPFGDYVYRGEGTQ